MVTITRVYNNGDIVRQTLTTERAEAELAYSMVRRPGCALFREADCIQVGYLGEARCIALSEQLKAANTIPAVEPHKPTPISELLDYGIYHSLVYTQVKGGRLLSRDVTRSAWELNILPTFAVDWWNSIKVADAPIR